MRADARAGKRVCACVDLGVRVAGLSNILRGGTPRQACDRRTAPMRCVVLSSRGIMQAMLPLAFAAGASGKTIVSLGTATPGGGFPVYGEAVAATINTIDPTLEVKPQNTKGSAENVPMLEAGKLDIALVQG